METPTSAPHCLPPGATARADANFFSLFGKTSLHVRFQLALSLLNYSSCETKQVRDKALHTSSVTISEGFL